MVELVSKASRWRVLGWGAAAALLAVPFVAMQFTRDVNWSASDFIAMGALIAIVGGLFELAVRSSRSRIYRAAFALALLGAFLVVWANLAVGIVGSDDNPANLWFFAALFVGVAGAALARLRAKGMAIAMLATALSLGLAFAIAVIGPTDEPWVSHWREFAGTAVFAALFLASAWLFRRGAQSSSSS